MREDRFYFEIFYQQKKLISSDNISTFMIDVYCSLGSFLTIFSKAGRWTEQRKKQQEKWDDKEWREQKNKEVWEKDDKYKHK